VALRAEGPLQVRGPLPGDRLALGGGGHARVGRLLADRGVPARLRHLVPVVVCDGRPLWVAGHRADAASLAAPGEPALLLEALPA
jgi:tRNA(Ile)-lysidine synthetase-like protein